MKKFLRTLCIALVAIVTGVAITACKPGSIEKAEAKMEKAGITPDDIKGRDDLHKLPFVTKDDLREAYPYGLLAKPLADCVRIQSTSGTRTRSWASPTPWSPPPP